MGYWPFECSQLRVVRVAVDGVVVAGQLREVLDVVGCETADDAEAVAHLEAFGGALSRGLHGGLAAYARDVFRAFEQGASPDDFPREDHERSWEERFSVERLNSLGRAGLGLE